MGEHKFASIKEFERARRKNDLSLFRTRTTMKTLPGSIFQMFQNGLPPTWGNIGVIKVNKAL